MQTLPKTLISLSTGYLLLPVIIFSAGYLRWYWGVPLAALLMWLFWVEVRSLRPHAGQALRISLGDVVIVAVVIGLSGIGGLGSQSPDWEKHNGVLKSLVEQPWPPVYSGCDAAGQDCSLLYYVAFYLPAGAVGKALGWEAANRALSLWAALGLLLAVLWFRQLVDRRGAWVTLYLVLFSGLDFIGYAVGSRSLPRLGTYLDYWPHLKVQFDAPFTSVSWGPQHCLAAWIALSLIYCRVSATRSARGLVFLWCLILAWSPLVGIGLAPFLGLALWKSRGRGLLSTSNVAACFLIVPIFAAYYLSSTIKTVHGPLWDFISIPHRFHGLLEVYLLEVAPFAFLYLRRPAQGADSQNRPWFWLSVLLLLLLPWYVFGYFGDLCTRASIPASFLLAVFSARVAPEWLRSPRWWRRAAFAAVFLVGSLTAISGMYRSVTNYSWKVPELARVKNPILIEPREYLGGQYRGRTDSVFYRVLARELHPARLPQ